MLNDWFSDVQLEISWETYLRLPRHPAYRYEFRNGHATITGNPRYYHCVKALTNSASGQPPALVNRVPRRDADDQRVRLQQLRDQDWAVLPELFAEAFSGSPPMAVVTATERLSAAEQLLQRTKSGADGPLVETASFVALNEAEEVLGSILVTLVPNASLLDFATSEWTAQPPPNPVEVRWGQPHLTWIFVKRNLTQRGLGQALLNAAEQQLLQLGYSTLASTFLLGDHASTLWHWKSGFRLLPRIG